MANLHLPLICHCVLDEMPLAQRLNLVCRAALMLRHR
jgi:hypothetical protein